MVLSIYNLQLQNIRFTYTEEIWFDLILFVNG